jgi:hypothetical protein
MFHYYKDRTQPKTKVEQEVGGGKKEVKVGMME